MKGIVDLYPFESLSKDNILIKKFSVNKQEARSFNLGQLFSGRSIMQIQPGQYVQLYVDGEIMMSDTPFELTTNSEFVAFAHGDVMIAGLGLGVIIYNLKEKVLNGEITSITVYEKNQAVIDVVLPLFKDFPIKCICKDILTYKPPKEEKYDTMYFDIWPTIDYEINLPEIRMLHNRWKSHKKTKDSWMNSWMKEFMQAERIKDRREGYI